MYTIFSFDDFFKKTKRLKKKIEYCLCLAFPLGNRISRPSNDKNPDW